MGRRGQHRHHAGHRHGGRPATGIADDLDIMRAGRAIGGAALDTDSVLAVQRTAGNAAATAIVQRRGGRKPSKIGAFFKKLFTRRQQRAAAEAEIGSLGPVGAALGPVGAALGALGGLPGAAPTTGRSTPLIGTGRAPDVDELTAIASEGYAERSGSDDPYDVLEAEDRGAAPARAADAAMDAEDELYEESEDSEDDDWEDELGPAADYDVVAAAAVLSQEDSSEDVPVIPGLVAYGGQAPAGAANPYDVAPAEADDLDDSDDSSSEESSEESSEDPDVDGPAAEPLPAVLGEEAPARFEHLRQMQAIYTGEREKSDSASVLAAGYRSSIADAEAEIARLKAEQQEALDSGDLVTALSIGATMIKKQRVVRMNRRALSNANVDEAPEVLAAKKVRYLTTDVERADFLVSMAGGSLLQGGVGFDTSAMSSYRAGAGWAMYVLSPAGALYAAEHKVSEMHHSTFMGGGDVACAGEIKVSDGTVTGITNKSGHYLPGKEHFLQMLDTLDANGVTLTGVEVRFYEGHGMRKHQLRAAGMRDQLRREVPDEPEELEESSDESSEDFFEDSSEGGPADGERRYAIIGAPADGERRYAVVGEADSEDSEDSEEDAGIPGLFYGAAASASGPYANDSPGDESDEDDGEDDGLAEVEDVMDDSGAELVPHDPYDLIEDDEAEED